MRFEIENITRSIYNRFGQPPDNYSPFKEWQKPDGSYEYSTLGPGNNEGITSYTYNGGSHKIRYVHYASPDILLVHQSKLVGFYLKMGSGGTIDPVDRSIKDQIIKDSSVR